MHKVIITSPIPDLDYGIMTQYLAEDVPEPEIPERLAPEARIPANLFKVLVSEILDPFEQFPLPVMAVKECGVAQVSPLLVGKPGMPGTCRRSCNRSVSKR